MKKTFRILLAVLLTLALALSLTACSKTETIPTTTEAPAQAPTEEPTEAPTDAPAQADEAQTDEAQTDTAIGVIGGADGPTSIIVTKTEGETDGQSSYDFTGTTLTVFNWYDYIDPAVLEIFEQETGAKIEYVNFTTNEEMYTKLEAGAASYDVIFPSDYMIERMIAADMLEELDVENMPHLSGVIDSLRNPAYDPEEKYSVPYMWGTLGILYNTEMVTDPVDSWEILFSEQYAGSVIMMNSQRDTIGLALKALGYSLNTRDESELNAAKDLLVKQKQDGITSGYLLDETKDKMVGGEAALSVVYSGDAIYAMEKNDALDYAVPKEGSNVWVDGMCIPKGSANKECAEAFIDFLCREDIAEMNLDYIYYCSPIQAAADSFPQDDARIYAVMNPASEVVERCEFFNDILDAMDIYEAVWMEIRLAR